MAGSKYESVSLAFLPVELIRLIAVQLPRQRDINALTQVDHHFYDVLNPLLYEIQGLDEDGGKTVLIWAAQNGQAETAQRVLCATRKLEDVINYTDPEFNMPALSWAAAKGHEAVVDLLLSTDGIDPDFKDNRHRTPLSHAAENGHVSIVRKLLAKDVEVNLRDSFHLRTPLLWAVAQNNFTYSRESPSSQDQFGLPWSNWRMTPPGIVYYQDQKRQNRNWRLDLNGDPDLTTDYNRERMNYQARWAPGLPFDQTVNLLINHGADLEAKDPQMMAPLAHAAARGSISLVSLLLQRGAKVNPETYPPLCRAAEHGDASMVKLLLKKGAIPQQGKRWWLDPLVFAARNGHATVVEILLQHSNGPRVLRDGTDTWEPLKEAVKYGHTKTLQLLLQYHKHTWSEISPGHDGLFWAAYGGWDTIFQMLLDAGAPLVGDCPYLQGIPILAAAVMGRDINIVKALLGMKEINVNARDHFGWTALDWATRIDNQEAEELLRIHGADPTFTKESDSIDSEPPHALFHPVGASRFSRRYPVPVR